MPYEHTREQSAEFLRLAVGYMGRQQANFDPASYTLWYEHAAGLNPGLSQILEEHLARQKPLTNVEVSTLFAQHIGAQETAGIGKLQQKLLEVMRETSAAMLDTGAHVAKFGHSLESHGERLRESRALEAIDAIVKEMLVDIKEMSAVNTNLARQLRSRASEVETLTQRAEKAESDALVDPLTGLLNRRGFEQAATELTRGTGQIQGATLLLVDVDAFKTINDSYGHQVGDQVLRGVAKVLKTRIKGADIAARLGGDEFALLLPDTQTQGALAVAEQIRKALLQANLRRAGGKEEVGKVSISIGASHAATAMTLEALLAAADTGLYEAKREGRNQVRLAKPESS